MSKRAILLVNLGSPESTSPADVGRYLREFLGDERVIDKPGQPFRWLLVNAIIVPFRASKSAHAYESVWTAEGSPLIVTSRKVRDRLGERIEGGVPVALAMRYGNPSIASVVGQLVAAGVEHVYLLPQYPQYAMSSWETVVVKVYEEFARQGPTVRVDCIQPFYRDADYIEALYASAAPHLSQPHDHLLFSFHGIPVRHLRKADSSHAHCDCVANCCEIASPVQSTCYRAQCLATVRAFVARAGIPADRYSVSFQSRLGKEPWLSPYTDMVLKDLPSKGKKRLLVMSPAFVADCLETLEEIAVEGKDTFLEAGGEWFQQIPCLNDQAPYIDFLERRVKAWLNS
ncbi:ferrochelatase [mine drainage metagenome]|uniref:Ferrochelatase n=1 Tax=mine drainage metagenome TaxID=410659 RepID=A0A1J5S6E1_9ZZZZ